MPTESSTDSRGRAVHFYRADGYEPGESVLHMAFKLLTRVRRDLETRMGELGLTDAQWKPLWMLARAQRMTVVELAREMCIDAGAMTRTLDRLHAKGLIERMRSEADRRVVDVQLTDAGLAAVRHVPDVLASTNNDYLRGFTRQEWTQLKDMLHRMLANGEALQREAGDKAP